MIKINKWLKNETYRPIFIRRVQKITLETKEPTHKMESVNKRRSYRSGMHLPGGI